MSYAVRGLLAMLGSILLTTPSSAQAPVVAPAGNAAIVNGQPIPEYALQRALERVPPAKRIEASREILDYLIDNMLVDQYLQQLHINADKKDVDKRVQEVRDDIKKSGKEFDDVLKTLKLTEAELRTQIEADLSWDVFIAQKATDSALKDLYTKEIEMFDGSQVHARHILLSPPVDDAQAVAQASAQLLALKQQIEKEANDALAKLPANPDKLAQERERCRLLDEAFAKVAREKSVCPSKDKGGDVSWFPRGGSMVEPFAKAAFELKPFQISEVVKTQFGVHLIMTIERKPGQPVKFEDVKDVVKEVYSGRLRDEVASRLRPGAKITITPPAK